MIGPILCNIVLIALSEPPDQHFYYGNEKWFLMNGGMIHNDSSVVCERGGANPGNGIVLCQCIEGLLPAGVPVAV